MDCESLSRDEVQALKDAAAELRRIAADIPRSSGIRTLLESCAGNLRGLTKTAVR